MPRLPMLLGAIFVVTVLVPAQARAFKPEIISVVASDDTNGVPFSVKVRMDKGGRDERKVSVTYRGERKRAHALDEPPLSHYETGSYSIPVRDCYRQVEVRARNQYGTTVRTMRAPMLGTDGCD